MCIRAYLVSVFRAYLVPKAKAFQPGVHPVDVMVAFFLRENTRDYAKAIASQFVSEVAVSNVRIELGGLLSGGKLDWGHGGFVESLNAHFSAFI